MSKASVWLERLWAVVLPIWAFSLALPALLLLYRPARLLPLITVQLTGPGLAIAESIVQHHGATIEADSREGRGSVFRVRLNRVGN